MSEDRLMKEHKRLLDETNLGAWGIYYSLEEFVKKKKKIESKSFWEKLWS